MTQNLKASLVIGEGYNPWYNLAVEEYLLDNLEEDEIILYLWQNDNTVVIGRNQNAWQECRVSDLEADGGKLARRLSGGGAVFHDLGNLNYTLLMPRREYDLKEKLKIILKALAVILPSASAVFIFSISVLELLKLFFNLFMASASDILSKYFFTI